MRTVRTAWTNDRWPIGPCRPCVPVAIEAIWDLNDWPVFKRIFNRRRATLADCTACGANYVHPVEWSPDDGESWWMLLRCGACGSTREETVSDSEAEVYDRELDRAEHRMRNAAERLSYERLAAQADSFATALELDLIGAEDFARPPDEA
jgi:hypothetical protein